MAATASALLLAGAVRLWTGWLPRRRELVRDLATLAAIVAAQTSAAVAFEDPGSATGVLRSLHAKEHVAAACVYLLDGRRFAVYGRRGGLGSCPASAADATGGSALSGRRVGRGVVEL